MTVAAGQGTGGLEGGKAKNGMNINNIGNAMGDGRASDKFTTKVDGAKNERASNVDGMSDISSARGSIVSQQTTGIEESTRGSEPGFLQEENFGS